MDNTSIYHDIAARTGGNIYLGVVGPVRTGKSTFVKRFMEQMVLPDIADPYRAERARDELPQSASGRTIMTAEPKFVPEEAAALSAGDGTQLRVRLIDSVGYMVDGAVGAEEDGKPRMITTPWAETQIPMTEAAELGTKKVMEEHATVGIVITTDGSITDIPRQSYAEAERRAIRDMAATGKPFVVVVNSIQPEGEDAQALAEEIRRDTGAGCVCMDCLHAGPEAMGGLLRGVLLEFPMVQVAFYLPGWVQALDPEHPLRTTLYGAMREAVAGVRCLRDAQTAAQALARIDDVTEARVRSLDLGTGTVSIGIALPEALFYESLSQAAGIPVESDVDLMELLGQMAQMKREYDQLAPALESVRATGYGIVMPRSDQMQLERPELCRRGGSYGVRLSASAPTIHLLRADLKTEISPTVGSEDQSRGLVEAMQADFENDPQALWTSNIFGRSVLELIGEGFQSKLAHLPEEARDRFRAALSRIVNEGAGGLICIIL